MKLKKRCTTSVASASKLLRFANSFGTMESKSTLNKQVNMIEHETTATIRELSEVSKLLREE